jgi:thiamine biosynthesis lipoprotein
MQIIRKPLFGKDVEIRLEDIDERMGESAAQEAYEEGLRLSKIFNFYDDKSEVSLLNKKRKMKVSEELLLLIKKAQEFSEMTNGDYDVSLGKVFRERKKGVDKKVSCSFEDIKIHKNNVVELTNPDVEIDLGSLAKGYIVDKIAENLLSQGILNGMVDGRGDIRVFGKAQTIHIQHPRKEGIIAEIKIKDVAVATSGDYKQFVGNFENCHIVNKKGLISVTVVAPSLIVADAIATAFFVADEKSRKKILENNKDVKIMAIDRNLNIKYYNGFDKIILEV